MKPFALFILLFCLTGCFVSRPRYSPPTDLESANMKGSVETVRSRYISLDKGEDPDDPARCTDFDMVVISQYNRRGNITCEETYGQGGQRLSRRDIYKFDETDGRLISSEYHDMLKDAVTWIHYHYDARGRLDNYNAVGGNWSATMQYGRRDYPVKLTTIVEDTVNLVAHYEYDKKGRLVKEDEITYIYNGSVIKEKIAEFYREYYDANGDMVRTVNIITDRSLPGGEETREAVVEAVYQYDDHGNWIRRELWMDGELFGVWIKEIGYFAE